MENLSTDGGVSSHPVIQALTQSPFEFEFMQAMRLLESVAGKDQIRIHAHIDQTYGHSDMVNVDLNKGHPITLVNFMGIAGAKGPLPTVYSEHIRDAIKRGNTAPRDFLDIFNHRLIDIFYRIHKTYTLGFDSDPKDYGPGQMVLRSLASVPVDSPSDYLSSRTLASYAGLLWYKARSAAGLAALLGGYFNTTCDVIPMQPATFSIPETLETKIGQKNINNMLGQTSILGRTYRDYGHHLKIILGPMNFKTYQDLLPSGSAYKYLHEIIIFYCGKDIIYDLILVLEGQDMTCLALIDDHTHVELGWTSFLKKGRFRLQNNVTVHVTQFRGDNL